MINDVVWLSLKKETPARGYWDQQLLEDVLRKKNHHTSIGNLKEAIVIVPTAYQDEKAINKEISKLDRVIFIATSDEENKFSLDKLSHPNIKIYGTYPHETTADVRWLPIGYTPHSKEAKGWLNKDIDILFAGQVNHEHRSNMVKELSAFKNFTLDQSGGFAQGLKPHDYIAKTKRAKVIPAPRGNISPDSFRLYEALENGAVPVAENPEFFDKLFGNYPFPVIESDLQWQGYVKDSLAVFPRKNNECSAWWHRFKAAMYREFNQDTTTVVIPVSPIKSHPSTEILDQTIAAIRKHTDAQIIVTFDGVRKEQFSRRKDYQLFINRFLSSGHENICPVIFNKHLHQSGMMRELFEQNLITTPLVLYIEQDTPLTPDREIDWEKCENLLLSGESSLIRFHFEAFIPEEHKHMMIGEPENGFIKTVQWSQRPHLATTAFYRRIISEYFTENSKCFIEDYMHGVVHNTFIRDRLLGWQQFRMHIYHPDGDIKRSYHLDGRAGEAKYDDTQIF